MFPSDQLAKVDKDLDRKQLVDKSRRSAMNISKAYSMHTVLSEIRKVVRFSMDKARKKIRLLVDPQQLT